ncbi:ADP-dependent NAD(P)H-hydrate dehydratase [Glaciibacter superstes]|uniref:ADP-dependent NAD(P)H-hydrate dehydratase n=1 Tax=Glaciibacter superstes TaxID=501023 RepID=UPI0003B3A26A|nr:ADP/ATP-dependent (S)-NAD(P)H-hydrate dehydratase [Glaciibacter superstes]
MAETRDWVEWRAADARAWIAVPRSSDDKYSRGVLGVRTGSDAFPGAAVLGVEAAIRTGLGMIRYLGPERPSALVLARRPEVVTVDGRVQAWLLGSGMSAIDRDPATTAALGDAISQGVPTVLDAGALDFAPLDHGPRVITPHYRELAGLLANGEHPVTAEQIASNPGEWAIRAAEQFDVTVLLKGTVTHIASPSGERLTVSNATAWLATAGTGDVLGGILGALVATHSEKAMTDAGALAALAATAAFVHGLAGERASAGGPLAALDVAEAVPAVIIELLAGSG